MTFPTGEIGVDPLLFPQFWGFRDRGAAQSCQLTCGRARQEDTVMIILALKVERMASSPGLVTAAWSCGYVNVNSLTGKLVKFADDTNLRRFGRKQDCEKLQMHQSKL